ncbi:MAG: aminopeptidase, partial [Clostridium sp.]|uniref:aminopeptidase n=1 Tax=Clostridium sp. TaxID=1506 RepID=UPI002FC8074B
NLGSIIFEKKGTKEGPKIMIAAHMDEVGFIVRSIDEKGMIHVIELGRVKPLAKFMQEVRITTRSGKKITGIINGIYSDKTNDASNVYVDIGACSKNDVTELGINIGDMVTYTTKFKPLELDNIVTGKAFDDRLGCFLMTEVIKELSEVNHDNDVYFTGTSSEEVGIRGGETATYKVNPDIVIAIEVACYQNEFVRDHSNNRQIGKGPMLTLFDRTMAPSDKIINFIRDESKKLEIEIQEDMFNSGGTDAGKAHLVRSGIPAIVLCLPVRYGHCAYSIGNINDIENLKKLLIGLIKVINKENYNKLVNFIEV